jgi:hypothetical protein
MIDATIRIRQRTRAPWEGLGLCACVWVGLAAAASSAMETEGLRSPQRRARLLCSSGAFPIRAHMAGLGGVSASPESATRSRRFRDPASLSGVRYLARFRGVACAGGGKVGSKVSSVACKGRVSAPKDESYDVCIGRSLQRHRSMHHRPRARAARIVQRAALCACRHGLERVPSSIRAVGHGAVSST